jgi:hypothetical protein
MSSLLSSIDTVGLIVSARSQPAEGEHVRTSE